MVLLIPMPRPLLCSLLWVGLLALPRSGSAQENEAAPEPPAATSAAPAEPAETTPAADDKPSETEPSEPAEPETEDSADAQPAETAAPAQPAAPKQVRPPPPAAAAPTGKARPSRAAKPGPARRGPKKDAAPRPAVKAPGAKPQAETRSGDGTAETPAAPFDSVELRALDSEIQALRKTGDGNSLQLLCDSQRAQKIFTERALYLPWQSLCRGWALQARGDDHQAQASFKRVLGQAASLSSELRSAAKIYAVHAQFEIAAHLDQGNRQYRRCLAELGHTGRGRLEAARRAELRAAAEGAYREVLRLDRGRWALKAMLQINSMSDAFYRDITAPPTGLRSLKVPPPLRRYALDSTPLTEGYLGPERSGLRRAVLLTYGKLLRRSRALGSSPELIEQIQQGHDAFRSYQPELPGAVQPGWPARSADDQGIRSLERDETGYQVLKKDGQKQRWSHDQAVSKLRQLLAPLSNGRWAPRACVELVASGDTASLPTLIAALKLEDDPELQVAAAYALGKLGDQTAIEPLLQAFVAAQKAAPRPLYQNASQATFGLEERVLEALAAIGNRYPMAVEGLLERRELPAREAAFVLWGAHSKSLYSTYQKLRDHRDPVVTAYGIMAMVDLQGETARWMLQDSPQDDALLRCARRHLADTLKP